MFWNCPGARANRTFERLGQSVPSSQERSALPRLGAIFKVTEDSGERTGLVSVEVERVMNLLHFHLAQTTMTTTSTSRNMLIVPGLAQGCRFSTPGEISLLEIIQETQTPL